MYREVTLQEALQLNLQGKEIRTAGEENLKDMDTFDFATIKSGKLLFFLKEEEKESEREIETAEENVVEEQEEEKDIRQQGKPEEEHEAKVEAEPDEETLRKLYIEHRWSAKKIADKYGMNVSKIFRIMKKYGIRRKEGPDEPIDYSCSMEREAR